MLTIIFVFQKMVLTTEVVPKGPLFKVHLVAAQVLGNRLDVLVFTVSNCTKEYSLSDSTLGTGDNLALACDSQELVDAESLSSLEIAQGQFSQERTFVMVLSNLGEEYDQTNSKDGVNGHIPAHLVEQFNIALHTES